MSNITAEEIRKIVEQEVNKIKSDDNIQMYYFCMGKGECIVQSTASLDLCNHPECKNCQGLQNAMKEEVKTKIGKQLPLNENKDMNFKQYKTKSLYEMIDVKEFIENDGDMVKVCISTTDEELAKEEPFIFEQGFVARNPKNHEDMWYVSKMYFDENLEEAGEPKEETFFDRLVREKDELGDKISKLQSFLANKEKAISISGHKQYEYLCLQKEVMAEYHDILVDRIIDIESKSEGV